MTVRFLGRMLESDTFVEIKDFETEQTVWEGNANAALFDDKVIAWDFSCGHVFYI